jgi:hypothetical protein
LFFPEQRTMEIPTGSPADLQSLLDSLLPACIEASAGAQAARGAHDSSSLVEAFRQLLNVMARIESDAQADRMSDSADITEIGEYALRLQEALAALATNAGLDDRQEPLALVCINIALWVADHGGRIDTLEPVVDALALLANNLREPARLEALSHVISRIVAAVSPMISQDLERVNPGRPWRVLLLNQSIIATRSHNPELMEQAFAVLTAKLPEDAPRFFTEGMQQMDALDYPEHVRKVMEKYHRQWTVNRALH